jgi:hypothetical protein
MMLLRKSHSVEKPYGSVHGPDCLSLPLALQPPLQPPISRLSVAEKVGIGAYFQRAATDAGGVLSSCVGVSERKADECPL